MLLPVALSIALLAATPDAGTERGEIDPAVDLAPVAFLPPKIGVRFDRTWSLLLIFPLQLQIGPTIAQRDERRLKRFRLLFEPTASLGSGRRMEWSFRGGFRTLWQTPHYWFRVGFGGGVSAALNKSVSGGPEVFLHMGDCCGWGFLTTAVRWELGLGQPDSWTFLIGLVTL